MTTTTDNLAAALRAINNTLRPLKLGGLCLDDDIAAELTRDARAALAAYDAERASVAREPAGSHTPEPWHVGPFDRIETRSSAGFMRRVICDMTHRPPHAVPAANDARRIVACVNACAGIPTGTLEGGRVVKVHTADHGDGVGTFERGLPPAVVMFTPHADVPIAAPGGDA